MSIARKMAVYEAQIVCITAVVSSTWSPDPILLQSHYIAKLDICHRKLDICHRKMAD